MLFVPSVLNRTLSDCAARLRSKRITLAAKLSVVAAMTLVAITAHSAPYSVQSEPSKASTANADKRFSARSASFASTLPASVQRSLPAVTASELAALDKQSKLAKRGNSASFGLAPKSSKLQGNEPKRVGIVRDLAAHRANVNLRELVWTKSPSGNWLAKLQISSVGALGMRLKLANTQDAKAAGLRFRLAGSAAPQLIEGPFLLSDYAAKDVWSAWTQGDTVMLEAELPAASNPYALSLAVSSVAHFDTDLLRSTKVGTCHRDAACETGAAEVEAAASTAKYTAINDGFAYFCTGTLMNDRDSRTQKPYFLTAEHCMRTAEQADSVITFWNYQSATCGGATLDARYVQVAGGASLLTASSPLDMSLLLLRGTPPGFAVFSGWDSSTLSGDPALLTTHHPDGSTKKVATARFTDLAELFTRGQKTHFRAQYMNGSPEPGSSGSAIRTLNGSWQVRGTISAGDSTCEQLGTGYHGRLDLATRVLAYLAADGTQAAAPDIAASGSTTANFAVGGAANSAIDFAGDEDWFAVTLQAGKTYTVTLNGIGGESAELKDGVLRLLDSSGRELKRNDDISEINTNAQLSYSPSANAVYFISAAGYASNTGTYRVAVTDNSAQPPPINIEAARTGWWWSATEPGQGFGIEIKKNRLFMGGFLYDDVGKPTWFLTAGELEALGSKFKGTIVQYYGGQTLTGPHKPLTSITDHGDISITFTSATTATMVWPGGTKMLSRFPIASGTVLEPAAGMPARGWYENLEEGGRGWMLEVQGNQMFIAGFMYDDAGYPTWYVSTGPVIRVGILTYFGKWNVYGHGQTYTSAWSAPGAIQTNANAGELTIPVFDSGRLSLVLPNTRIIDLVPYKFY